jgi:hypothetical protein
MAEALEMASVIVTAGHGHRGTAIPGGARCESACAIAFMAGSWRLSEEESVQHNRVIHPRGTLGFHAPDLVIPEGSFSAIDVRSAFGLALEALAQIVERRSAGQYDFPESLLLEMLRTSSDEMFYIETVGQAARLNIAVVPAGLPNSDAEQIVVNICQSLDAGFLDQMPGPVGWFAPGRDIVQITPAWDDVFSAVMSDGFRGEAASGCHLNINSVNDPRGSIGTGYIGTVESGGIIDMGPIYAYFAFPPETRLVDLPQSFTYSLRSLLTASSAPQRQMACSIDAVRARVVNVNEYVNIRSNASLRASVVVRAALGEVLTVTEPSRWYYLDTERGRQCANACNSLPSNQSDPRVREQVESCIDGAEIWQRVRNNRGQQGFVSVSFLEALE